MTTVYIASSLARHSSGEHQVVLNGSTVEDVLQGLEDRFPGFGKQVVDAHGALRPHIALFLNDAQVPAHSSLRMPVGHRDEISIISAIAGG